ncbi:MAG: CHASE4 domain-containing protein [Desulfocapsaceae bacterium]|nr:CHASE4 domain-containing protein [Desulfocapsaceae bacterium]
MENNFLSPDGQKNGRARLSFIFDSIRYKTLFILICTFLVSFLLMHTVSKFVLMESFQELEVHSAKHSLREVNNAIQSRLDLLDTINRDWAWWDDVYSFIETGSPEFIASNLTDETFTSMKLDFLGFFDREGKPVSLNVFDKNLGKKIAPPSEFITSLKSHHELLIHKDAQSFHKGLVQFPHGAMLFTSRPILTSEQKGPVRGALIFGRYLDDEEVKLIAESQQIILTIIPLPLTQGTSQQTEILQSMQQTGEQLAVQSDGEDSIAAFLQINDISGHPLLLLKAKLERSIYQLGLQTKSTLHWFFMLMSIVICLVVALILELQVIAPVMHVIKSVSRIGSQSDPNVRIIERGPLEIRQLATSINSMLATLARYAVELDKTNCSLAKQNKDIEVANIQLQEEITERKILEKERENLISELKEALAQVKTLSGFLPICAACKKIRDDKGYWNQIEEYIRTRSDVQFSHSICPDCAKKLYGDFLDLDTKE